MTRLKVDDIKDIEKQLRQYDDELLRKTGCTVTGIACHAVGVKEEEIRRILSTTPAAVVPITSGRGVITGFSQTVKAILEFIGVGVFITTQTDVAGTAEAFEKGAHLLFMADDHRFVALNLKDRSVVDNAAAAGKGFAAGLDLMGGGLTEEKVMVLGCGPVGFAAVFNLLSLKARVSVYDTVSGCSHGLREKISEQLNITINIEKDMKQALSKYRFIIDATNAAGIISEEVITPLTFIAAPGLPLGLTPGAVTKISGRLLHDPLQIGVAVMAVEAVKG
jgi:pyrrolysine biosynthesis protein PylD